MACARHIKGCGKLPQPVFTAYLAALPIARWREPFYAGLLARTFTLLSPSLTVDMKTTTCLQRRDRAGI